MTLWLQKIDKLLLPQSAKDDISPYVWLIYLPLFFIPVFFFPTSHLDRLLTVAATIIFLVIYFHSFWVPGKVVIIHVVLTIATGTLAAFISPSASSLFYLRCGFLWPTKTDEVRVFSFVGYFAVGRIH